MRKTPWIVVIGLALGLAVAAPDHRESRSVRASTELAAGPAEDPVHPAGELPARDRQRDAQEAAAASQPVVEKSQARGARSAANPDAAPIETTDQRLADLGPEAQVTALSDEIERAREERGLRVDPAILASIRDTGTARVVFDLPEPTPPNALAAVLSDRVARAEVDELRVFPLIGHGAARLGPDALRELIATAAAHHVELDVIHRPMLLESVAVIRADETRADGHGGDGFAVAVIDTGVEASHPMLAGRVVEEACFSLLSQCPNAATQMLGPGAAEPCAVGGCGHGTHVAGIAVGYDPADGFAGVAPEAALIAIQVFSEVAPGEIGAYTSDILAGLQHVLGLAPFHSIAAVNLSLGGSAHTSEASCDGANPSQRSVVDQLRAAGITVVAASGNEGLTNAITSPACLSNVLSVGATDDLDSVSGFSNGASFLSLLAPGQSIRSSARGARRGIGSGTSAAAPHVAGAIAAAREAHPSASVGELENALALSGVPVVDGRNGETAPRIDVAATIALLGASATPPPVGPPTGPVSGTGGPPSATASTAGSGGGSNGSQCGLVGLEPFAVLALVRAHRRVRRRGAEPGRRGAEPGRRA